MNRIAYKVSIASLAALLFSPVTSAFGATTIVDNFGDGGWQNSDTRDAAGTNVGPAGRVDLDISAPVAGPSGYNALRLTTDTTSAKATLGQSGLNLGNIADFSGTYNWYKSQTGAPAPAFRLAIDTSDVNPSSSRPDEANWDKFLIYEPYDNPDSGDPGTNVWKTQSFDLNNGTWWMFDRSGPGTVNPPHTSLTLQQWLNDSTYGARLTGATIVGTQLGTGSGNANLTGYVDSLSYTYGASPSTETYYFGNAVPEPTGIALIGLGAGALLLRRRGRRSVA
jgi:hypothetical protein